MSKFAEMKKYTTSRIEKVPRNIFGTITLYVDDGEYEGEYYTSFVTMNKSGKKVWKDVETGKKYSSEGVAKFIRNAFNEFNDVYVSFYANKNDDEYTIDNIYKDGDMFVNVRAMITPEAFYESRFETLKGKKVSVRRMF